MDLSLNFATSDRKFARATFRIRPRLAALLESFGSAKMEGAEFDAIIVGITDDQPEGYFEAGTTGTTGEFYQALVGCRSGLPDDDLARQVFEIMWRVVLQCPLTKADRLVADGLFVDFARENTWLKTTDHKEDPD